MRKHFVELNKTYRVKTIPAGLNARLAGFGITENSVMKIKAFAPLGDPVVITVRGVDYALRQSALRKFAVVEVK